MRPKYRTVKKLKPHGVVFEVQIWRWWLPFWSYVSQEINQQAARQAAENHRNRRSFKEEITRL